MLIEFLNSINTFTYIIYTFGMLLFILECFVRLKKLAGICGISLILLSIVFCDKFIQGLILFVFALIVCTLFYYFLRIRKYTGRKHIK